MLTLLKKKNPPKYESSLIAEMGAFNRCIDEAKLETMKAPAFAAYHIKAFGQIKHVYYLINVLMCHALTEELRADSEVQLSLKHIKRYLEEAKKSMEEPGISHHSEALKVFHQDALLMSLLSGIRDELALFKENLDKALEVRTNHWQDAAEEKNYA